MDWVEQVCDEAEDILGRARGFYPDQIRCVECRRFVMRVITGTLGSDWEEEREWLRPTVRKLQKMGVPGSQARRLVLKMEIPHRQGFPFQHDEWWLRRGSGVAHKRIRRQREVLGPTPTNEPPGRGRGRPPLGIEEPEIRAWADDVHWWLEHVAHRRVRPDRRWGHLRKVLREMLPRRVPTGAVIDLEGTREWAKPLVTAFAAATSFHRVDKRSCTVRDLAHVLSLLLRTTRAQGLQYGKYVSEGQILRALRRRVPGEHDS